VNAQLESLGTGSGALALAAQALALYQLTCDPKWDPIFDREDANGFKSTREDLLVRLRDWVDIGTQASALRATFGSTSCSMVPLQPPFESSFGDKNQPYDRGSAEERYKVKNAHMDSLDELYLVAGVSDTFMAAFGDQLTVYLPRDQKRNVNQQSRDGQWALAQSMADPPVQPALLDPTFLDRLQKLLMAQTAGGILSINAQQFGRAVELAGVKVRQAALSGPSSPFTDRSTTFSIRSTGTAGDVKTTVEAIVRMEKQTPGEALGAPGRVIHWREE
jgi:general secretion pathway protein K